MIVTTWDGYNINNGSTYVSGLTSPILSQAAVQVNHVERHGRYPLIGGVSYPARTIMVTTIITSSTPAAARALLRTYFETESGEIKTLVITGDGGVSQYIKAVCEAHYEEDEVGNTFYSVLRVHDDTAWRSVSVLSDTETVIASGQEWEITNAGDQIARPTITITPKEAQPNINPYRRFVAVQWRGDGAADYPTDITSSNWDTETLVTESKMQATGNDIRVIVNGIAVDYWLNAINTDTTSVWVNLTWQKAISLTAAVAIAVTGTVETIDVNQNISAMPSTGILMIDNELFIYTSKNNSLRRFTILARAAHGTAAAAHTVGDTVYWIQHAIELQYGNDDFAAWPSHASRKPAFELATSENNTWDYDGFGDRVLGEGAKDVNPVILPASWQYTGGLMEEGLWIYTCYTASQFPNAPGGSPFTTSPWAVAGLYQGVPGGYPIRWRLHCPCGITAVNFQNGYKYAGALLVSWKGYIVSSVDGSLWANEYTIPTPSALTTWQTWSQDETTLTANSRYIGLELGRIFAAGGAGHYLEAGDATLTFDTNLTPLVYMASEVGNYSIEATLTHEESGWALQISFAGAIDQSLVINTDTGEITSTVDGSSQFQAVRRFPRSRVEWLPLLPGVNTLIWTEVGVVEMDVKLQWQERRGA